MAKKKAAQGAKRSARSQPEETGAASTGRPTNVDTARAELLAIPPEPSAEELAARERYLDRTHKQTIKIKDDRPRGEVEESAEVVAETSPAPPDEDKH